MNRERLEAFLLELKYTATEGNIKLMKKVLNKYKYPDVLYRRLPVLIHNIEKCKGFVGISSSEELIKIDCDSSALNEEIKREFVDICVKWSDKYKIGLMFCPTKDLFYIEPNKK